jgi:hypothetical protein
MAGPEGLVLGGSGHLAFDGQVGKKLADFCLTHFRRMSFALKKDELSNPAHIGLLSAQAVMANSDGISNQVQEFGGRLGL